jgi:hypothetical protein
MAEAPYIDLNGAINRLINYNVDDSALDTLAESDFRLASDELDAKGPFKGTRPEGQVRQFPRVDPETGDPEAAVPNAVLDWVALRALQISTDEAPAVKTEGAGRVSVGYFTPKIPQIERRMRALLCTLQLKTMGAGGTRRPYPTPRAPWNKRTG